jgi:hypothetical protein
MELLAFHTMTLALEATLIGLFIAGLIRGRKHEQTREEQQTRGSD